MVTSAVVLYLPMTAFYVGLLIGFVLGMAFIAALTLYLMRPRIRVADELVIPISDTRTIDGTDEECL